MREGIAHSRPCARHTTPDSHVTRGTAESYSFENTVVSSKERGK